MIGFWAAGAMGSGGGGAWTPGSLNPYSWWNDTSSITTSSGFALNWQDIGSAGVTMEAGSESLAPAVAPTGLNGRRTLTFPASSKRYWNNGSAIRNVFAGQSAGWAFAVVRRRNADGSPTLRNLFVVPTAGDSGGGSRFVAALAQGAANTPALLTRRQDSDSTAVLNGVTSIGTTWAMVLWSMDWSSGAGAVYLNGDLDAANASLTTPGSTTAVQSGRAVCVGGFPVSSGTGPGVTNHADCDLAELIVSRGVLPSGDIDRLFGYAAHRWGLASELDVSHPYKSAPP